jgi:hypothetical protein
MMCISENLSLFFGFTIKAPMDGNQKTDFFVGGRYGLVDLYL